MVQPILVQTQMPFAPIRPPHNELFHTTGEETLESIRDEGEGTERVGETPTVPPPKEDLPVWTDPAFAAASNCLRALVSEEVKVSRQLRAMQIVPEHERDYFK